MRVSPGLFLPTFPNRCSLLGCSIALVKPRNSRISSVLSTKLISAMAFWQDAVQTTAIALMFAVMVAKLLSVVISFRGNNMRLERESSQIDWLISDVQDAAALEEFAHPSESESRDDNEELDDVVLGEPENLPTDKGTELVCGALMKEEDNDYKSSEVDLYPPVQKPFERLASSVMEEKAGNSEVGSAISEFDRNILEGKNEDRTESKKILWTMEEMSDSDDWEGIESSELEETFGAAATFVATQGIGPSFKLSNETQLLLYGLYKLATEGPCSTPQPSAYKISARAKWNAWQKLGNVGLEEAMHRYIAVVSGISPGWAQGKSQTEKRARGCAERDPSSGIGPVFSSLVTEEGVDGEGTLEAIHVCAREGDQAGLQQQIENGTPVDTKDSDGRTALHWAADQGHLHAVKLLLSKGAQIHAKDLEGQTALHYAVTCEQEEIAKVLFEQGAEPCMKDNDGICPLSSRPAHWFWMGGTT